MSHGLLLLHGFTGDPASWDPVRMGLPAELPVLAPWLVGHGNDVHGDIAGFEDEVDRIVSLTSAELQWHVAGYSLGGRIALGLLVRHPARFASATLIGAQPGLESESARAERRAGDERWCDMLTTRPLTEFVTAWAEQPLFETQRSLPDAVLARQRTERLGHDPRGLIRSLRSTGLGVMPSYWEALSGVTAPTTLLVGSRDEKFAAVARRMATLMPMARVEAVAGAGHNVLLERPEAVRDLIHLALERTGAS